MQANPLLVVSMMCLAGCVNCPHPDPAPLIQESFPPPAELQVNSEPADSEPADSGQADSGQAESEHHVVWSDGGMKVEEGWTAGGAREGPWTAWYPTGAKKWRGDYRAGDPTGLWQYWHGNGRRQTEIEFADGKLWRIRRFRRGMDWYREELYLDGIRDGPWISIESNGQRTMSYYINGVRVKEPWTSQTVEACVYRLNHSPDPEVRLQAAMTLIQHGVSAGWAVRDLVRALDDPDLRVVREVTVALGIIGEGAGEAIEKLSQLAGQQDRQVAEAARAALRQVEGARSPDR